VDFFDGSWVQHILANYGYAAIFIVVMLESAGVPLPGETILVSAAAFAGNKHSLDIRYVIAAAAGGAIFGDNIGFWVGREFGTSLLSRWGYLIGLDERKRKLGQYLFARHGGRSSSSDVSSLCCAPLRHCWLEQMDCPLCGSSSSMRRGNCLGDSVRSWRIRAWRRYSSNRWTIWMGGAYCSDRFGRPSLALLQEK